MLFKTNFAKKKCCYSSNYLTGKKTKSANNGITREKNTKDINKLSKSTTKDMEDKKKRTRKKSSAQKKWNVGPFICLVSGSHTKQ